MRSSALLARLRRGQRVEPLRHHHPAGGAARPAAAHGGVRHAVVAQGLEHGCAGQDREPPSARMRQGRRRAAPIAPVARRARTERQAHQADMDAEHAPGDVIDRRRRLRRAVGALARRPDIVRILRCAQRLIAGGDEAGKRQRRQQHGKGAECDDPVAVPGLGPQPEVNADRGVQPDHDERQDLQDAQPRPRVPERQHRRAVGRAGAQRELGDAGGGHVSRQQERDAQPKRELPQLPARHSQAAPVVDRPQRIGVMRQECRRQQRGAGRGPPRPHQQRQRGVRPLEGDQQRDMGGHVHDHEGEQDQAAAKPQPAPHRSHVPGRRHLRWRNVRAGSTPANDSRSWLTTRLRRGHGAQSKRSQLIILAPRRCCGGSRRTRS